MKNRVLIMALMFAAAGCSPRSESALPPATPALTPAEIEAGILTPEVMWKMGRIASPVLSPDGERMVYTLTVYDMEANRGTTGLWIAELGGEPRRLSDGAHNDSSPQWSADGSMIYFLSDRSGSSQLWAVAPDGSGLRQLSSSENDIEGFGVAPTGRHLFYVQPVSVKPVCSAARHTDCTQSRARIYDDLMVRHWNYWDEGSYRHIFVADLGPKGIGEGTDILGPEAAWDAPLAPYFDMAEIAWNHAGTQLAYTAKPLTGRAYAESTDSDIFLYDVATGRTRNLCKSDAGTDAGRTACAASVAMPGYDKGPIFSPDDRRIAFRSMRRAGNESDKERLFVLDLESGRMDDLTAGFDYNATLMQWDGNEALWFIAPIEATHQLCRVGFDGRVEVVTRGDHDLVSLSAAGGRLIAGLTTLSSADEIYEIDPKTGELTQRTFVNRPVYDHIRMGQVLKRWVPTTDGKQMLTWVVLPPDFDPARKYPALLYCQGGPQSVVSQFWSYRWNLQSMAAQGYVVVAPNRRGLPSFGQEWLDQISGDYSGQNIRDYLSAIDDVAREEWIDRDRLGCVGASYGGYSVFYLAGNHDKRFKAFIAHCGIFDFDSMYGETEELWFLNNDYGGPYWDRKNATAMRSYAHSPHRYVDRWDTPILIFTGELDYRIPFTQSLEAFTAARCRGLDARLVVFENEGHQVFKPQNSLVWNREFFGWLDRYVKGAR